jgi:hypothetical protein
MSPFLGGSAPGMANQIAEGYTLMTSVQLKRLSDPEMDQLLFELERTLRDLRAEQPALDDITAIQARSRKISRVMGAVQQIQMARGRRKRGV